MIEDVIKTFRSVASRDRLYAEIEECCPLIFESVHDHAWSSVRSGGQMKILHCQTNQPEAALAHELLHIKLTCDGYRPYISSLALTQKGNRALPKLLAILNNEIQHHRFYTNFLALGFSGLQMYCDSDAESYTRVADAASQLSGEELAEDFLRLYVTLIAPGGAGSSAEKERAFKILQSKAGSKWNSLRHIKNIIEEYRDATGLDPQTYIRRILQVLGGYEMAWVGFDNDFPRCGFFTTEAFTREEGEAAELQYCHFQ
jgi:hypothetical protein